MKLFRTVLMLVLVCALAVVGAQWLNDPALRRFGQVVVQIGGHDYVSTLPKAGLLLLIAALLLWLLWTVLAAPFRAFLRYRRRQARARLIDGLTALHHGRWLGGEKLLLAAADDARAGPVALSAALRAADKRGDDAAAARHLQKLQEIDPLRHALLQARRLLGSGQPDEALALLDTPALQPLPPRGLVLRQRALAALGRAEEAYGLLGSLRSQQAMSAEQIVALERPLATQMLEQAADRNALATHWDALPKALRSEPEIVAAYARRAIALDWPEPAARALEQVLDSHWTPDLLPLHAQASTTTEPAEQADQLQRWLASHPDDPALLLRAGQLAMRRQQWQLARDHLLRARDAGAAEAAWEALGESHARQGQDALASTCLLNAVRLRRGEAVQPLEDEPASVAGQRDAHGLPHLGDSPVP